MSMVGYGESRPKTCTFANLDRCQRGQHAHHRVVLTEPLGRGRPTVLADRT